MNSGYMTGRDGFGIIPGESFTLSYRLSNKEFDRMGLKEINALSKKPNKTKKKKKRKKKALNGRK